MSRDPPNVIVTRKQLKEALRGEVSRSRRGEGGVTRRLENSAVTNSRKRGRSARAVGSREGGTGGNAHSSHGQRTSTAVAPPGWEPPQIQLRQRSPIQLRPRIEATIGVIPGGVPADLVEDITGVSDAPFALVDVTLPTSHSPLQREATPVEVSDDIRFFNPGASPPEFLVCDPVHSPSDHASLDENAFPKRL